MAQCSRCGNDTHCDYGSDGLPYCESCRFYGMNKPCFRCRMYLPAIELQQYKGQWMCPYCLMDVKDEDRRIDEPNRSYGGKGDEYQKSYQSGESCERCGRQTETIYYLGGKRLCASCVNTAKGEWKDTGGEKPPLPMMRVTEKKAQEPRKMNFMEKIFAELLSRFGIRGGTRNMKESEIVALRKQVKVVKKEKGELEKQETSKDSIPLVYANVRRRRGFTTNNEVSSFDGEFPTGSTANDSESNPVGKEEIELEKEKPQTEPMVEGAEKREKRKGKKNRNDVTFTNFEGESKEEKKKRKEGIAKKKKEGRFGGFKKD